MHFLTIQYLIFWFWVSDRTHCHLNSFNYPFFFLFPHRTCQRRFPGRNDICAILDFYSLVRSAFHLKSPLFYCLRGLRFCKVVRIDRHDTSSSLFVNLANIGNAKNMTQNLNARLEAFHRLPLIFISILLSLIFQNLQGFLQNQLIQYLCFVSSSLSPLTLYRIPQSVVFLSVIVAFHFFPSTFNLSGTILSPLKLGRNGGNSLSKSRPDDICDMAGGGK